MSSKTDHAAPMRILFLCKRRYMGRDVIIDRYARMYEFPYQMAKQGHAVLSCSLSYHYASKGSWVHDAAPGSLEWRSFNMGRTILPGLIGFLRETDLLAHSFKPDIVIGASDIPHCHFARRLGEQLGIPYALDLYDNFESYGQARIPGAKRIFHTALRKASLVSCVSEPLADYVRALGAQGEVLTLRSTVDKSIFKVRNRLECRQKLGLPLEVKLVGTAGALHQERGIATLYEAFEQLAAADENLHLVLAGPADAQLPPPTSSRVHYLGQIPHGDVASLFSALDVGVICLRDTLFGRYCFPQKAFEMVACGIPVVAADVGAMPVTFSGFPRSLYRRDDADSLAEQISHQLQHPVAPKLEIQGWDELAATLEQSLLRTTARR